MAGRNPIPPSYIVDLLDIADQILDNGFVCIDECDVIIPVYENNFSKDIARKLIFLADYGEIYQSIKSDFICDLDFKYREHVFRFTDKFAKGNESGYIFGSIDISHPDSDPITLAYYWR